MVRKRREPKPSVTPVPFKESRKLISIHPNALLWALDQKDLLPVMEEERCEYAGAIARVYPPFGASDEKVASVCRGLKEYGIAAVRVMPRERADALPESKKKVAAPPKRHREVVLEIAQRSARRDELAKLLCRRMDEAGL